MIPPGLVKSTKGYKGPWTRYTATDAFYPFSCECGWSGEVSYKKIKEYYNACRPIGRCPKCGGTVITAFRVSEEPGFRKYGPVASKAPKMAPVATKATQATKAPATAYEALDMAKDLFAQAKEVLTGAKVAAKQERDTHRLESAKEKMDKLSETIALCREWLDGRNVELQDARGRYRQPFDKLHPGQVAEKLAKAEFELEKTTSRYLDLLDAQCPPMPKNDDTPTETFN